MIFGTNVSAEIFGKIFLGLCESKKNVAEYAYNILEEQPKYGFTKS